MSARVIAVTGEALVIAAINDRYFLAKFIPAPAFKQPVHKDADLGGFKAVNPGHYGDVR